MPEPQRRLVAILAADVVGYTRLAEAAEAETHARLMRLRAEVLDPGVAAAGGRVVKNTGDGFLAVFEEAGAAVACAVALQRAAAAATADQPPALRIAFRMAVHAAEAIFEAGDAFGDGVNVAARLEGFAEPGDVIVSAAAAERMAGGLGAAGAARVVDLGELPLRNHARPVRAYALRADPAGRPARAMGEAAPGEEPRPSVAVLPFRKNQSDPEEGYFADGVVDEIVHALSGLRDVFVVSRGSALAHARHAGGAAALEPVAVGQRLGVRYVLHGGVRRAGGRVRITTELTDAESGAVLGADQYEGRLDELFEMQDRISLKLVKTIAPRVRERELRRALRKPPQSMTAYDLLLQALDLLYRMDADSFARARGLLQRAMALDPGYAPPYTYAAFWHVFRVGEIGSPDPDADGRAAAALAAAALERNASDALALALHGHVQGYLLRDRATALRLLDRALEAGPGSAMAWTMSSATRGYAGDGAAAVEHAERGVRLAPADPYAFWHEGILAQAHHVAGDFEQAVAWARGAVAHNRAVRFTLRTLAASLSALGRAEEAADAVRRLLEVDPGFRVGAYARRCPFAEPVRGAWLERLRAAGLPE